MDSNFNSLLKVYYQQKIYKIHFTQSIPNTSTIFIDKLLDLYQESNINFISIFNTIDYIIDEELNIIITNKLVLAHDNNGSLGFYIKENNLHLCQIIIERNNTKKKEITLSIKRAKEEEKNLIDMINALPTTEDFKKIELNVKFKSKEMIENRMLITSLKSQSEEGKKDITRIENDLKNIASEITELQNKCEISNNKISQAEKMQNEIIQMDIEYKKIEPQVKDMKFKEGEFTIIEKPPSEEINKTTKDTKEKCINCKSTQQIYFLRNCRHFLCGKCLSETCPYCKKKSKHYIKIYNN
jgi:hypothetical protein